MYLTEEPALEWNVDTFRVSRRSWNARGELACESLPDFVIGFPSCTSSASYLEHSYDALGRLTKTSRGPATVDLLTITYDVQNLFSVPGIEVLEERRVHSSPSPDRVIQRGFDARGRVVSVSEAASGETILVRDPKGRITTVDGPNVEGDPNLLLLAYNSLDQRTLLVPPAHAPGGPEAPAWIYEYDSNGNLSQQTSPALITIGFEYDRLNRLTKEDVPTAGADVTYLYDNTSLSQGIGRLYRAQAPGVTTTYHYDLRGRVLTLLRDFGGGLLYDVDYSYDLADRVAGIYYPNGKTVWPGWDGTEQVGIHLSGDGAQAVGEYHESGALQEITFGFSGGPTTTTTNDFDPATHWLETIVTTSPSPVGEIQNVVYDYDAAGNVRSANGSPLTQAFGYDSLHRLTSATAGEASPGNYGNLVYDYDGAGNILSITANAGTPRVFTYGGNGAGPQALTSVTQEDGPTRSYTYDGDGNTTSAGPFALPRDDFGRVKSAATLSYTYDHTGERVRKRHGSGLIDRLYVTEGFEVDLGTESHEIHLFLAGRRVATASFPGNGLSTPGSPAEPRYYHADWLGSNAVVTDAAGAVIQESFFEPFGKVVSTIGADATEYLFTDQEHDDESGLMYFGARFYDPEVGRFLEEDPILALGFDTQTFNAYTYVLNRPTAFIDPSGLLPCIPFFGAPCGSPPPPPPPPPEPGGGPPPPEDSEIIEITAKERKCIFCGEPNEAYHRALGPIAQETGGPWGETHGPHMWLIGISEGMRSPPPGTEVITIIGQRSQSDNPLGWLWGDFGDAVSHGDLFHAIHDVEAASAVVAPITLGVSTIGIGFLVAPECPICAVPIVGVGALEIWLGSEVLGSGDRK